MKVGPGPTNSLFSKISEYLTSSLSFERLFLETVYSKLRTLEKLSQSNGSPDNRNLFILYTCTHFNFMELNFGVFFWGDKYKTSNYTNFVQI